MQCRIGQWTEEEEKEERKVEEEEDMKKKNCDIGLLPTRYGLVILGNWVEKKVNFVLSSCWEKARCKKSKI